MKEGRPGSVLAISTSRRRGVPKANVAEARLLVGMGVEGDAHAGAGHRQVSLLAVESIEKIRARGLAVRPGAFAENVTTAGVDLMGLRVGDRVRIGDCELEVTQIGKECHDRCEIFRRAGDCVMPREGIFARVLAGGTIRVGDPIRIEILALSETERGGSP